MFILLYHIGKGERGQMVMEGDLTRGGEHTIQHIDDVLH